MNSADAAQPQHHDRPDQPNKSGPARPRYHSFLVRFWQEGRQPEWHGSVQPTVTEQIYQFANLQALLAFLRSQIAQADLHEAKEDE